MNFLQNAVKYDIFQFGLPNGMKMQAKSYDFLVVSMLARLLESYQDIVVYVDNLDTDMKKKHNLPFGG